MLNINTFAAILNAFQLQAKSPIKSLTNSTRQDVIKYIRIRQGQ